MTEKEERELISAIVQMAKISRLYFEELIRNGFDPIQALELTKVHGFNMLGGGGKQ